MKDLRKAAEMALKQLQRDDVYLGHRSKTRADAIEALRQALDDKPPVKSYCGGEPNYCTPVDGVYMSEERVHKSDKSMHEPVAIVNAGMGYTAPYTKLDTSDGVSHKDRLIRIMGTFDLATGHADTMDQALDALEQELRDVLGYLRARREWVGLTDEDLLVCDEDGVLLARYWEAKLKEKNR